MGRGGEVRQMKLYLCLACAQKRQKGKFVPRLLFMIVALRRVGFKLPTQEEKKTRTSNSLITLGPTCATKKGQFELNKKYCVALPCALFLLREELSLAKFSINETISNSE